MENKQYPTNLEELKKLLSVDSLPGNRKSQDTFLTWVQQKIQEQDGLKSLLEQKDELLTELRETELDSLPDLDSIAKKAIRKGAIQIGHLVYIMAREREYEKTLPALCEFFEKSVTRGIKKEFIPKSIEDRCAIWLNLFTLWAGLDLDPEKGDPKKPNSRFWEHPNLGRIAMNETFLNVYDAFGELKPFGKVRRNDLDFVKIRHCKKVT